MSLETKPFEDFFAIPSKNGLTRPSRVRGSGIKMINMGELFAHGRIDNIDMELVPVSDRELETMLVQEGDLLFARQSLVLEGAGSCSIVLAAPEPTTFESHIIRVRLKKDEADPKFFYYYFRSPSCGIRSIVTQGVQAGIRARDLRRLPVSAPTLKVQRSIASLLNTYDDLIANNRRRIELLEQSARLLFTEWFVALRYPGHEHNKIIGGVAEGWELSTVASVCRDFIDGDWLESKDQGGQDFRILQISNIGDNAFVETGNYRYITERTFGRLNCSEIFSGDILISRMPTPIGRAWLVTKQAWRMVTAVDVTIARPHPEIVGPYYLLHHLNSAGHLARCAAAATGATRPRIAKRVMGALPILIPPKPLQNEFESVVAEINELKDRLTKQCDALARARDLLLPRLIDGRIAV